MNKVLHIFSNIENETSHVNIIVDFFLLLNRNKSSIMGIDNKFIIKTNQNTKKILEEKLLHVLFDIEYLMDEIQLLLEIKKYESYNLLIFHQFPSYKNILIYLQWNLQIIKKSMWYIWGGDLYTFNNYSKSIRGFLLEKVLKRRIVKNFKYIGCWNKYDFDIAKRIYKTKAAYLKAYYSSNIEFKELISKGHMNNSYSTKNILIGNSGNPSNNHIHILENIKFLFSENIHVFFIFSYAGNDTYYEGVINYAKKNLNGKFTIIYKYMDYNTYTNFLATMDICIMHQNRQQGAGLLLWLFLLGKKIYLNPDSATYQHYTLLGCKICKSTELNNESFDDFTSYLDTDITKNQSIISKEYSDSNLINYWKVIFDS